MTLRGIRWPFLYALLLTAALGGLCRGDLGPILNHPGDHFDGIVKKDNTYTSPINSSLSPVTSSQPDRRRDSKPGETGGRDAASQAPEDLDADSDAFPGMNAESGIAPAQVVDPKKSDLMQPAVSDQREFINIYHQMAFPKISTGTAQNLTVANLTVTGSFSGTVPTGSVLSYAGSSAPSGWLICDGSAVSRTGSTATLFSVVGVTYGSGDGSTTFNLPDLRGKFERGFDNGAGNDPDAASRTACSSGGNSGNHLGSCQSGQFASHNHGITDPGHVHGTSTSNGGSLDGTVSFDTRDRVNGPGLNTLSNTTGITINNAGGNETRPINVYFNFIIKTQLWNSRVKEVA